MKNKKIALILNVILVISELIAIVLLLFKGGIDLIYYTNLSNILALIVSVLFIINYKKKSKLINDLRFMSTSCLMVTFLVVLFILSPMYQFNYKLLMFTDVFFILHTLCPLLSIISYIFFEDGSKKKYLGFAFTLFYGIVLIILNALRIVNGPYPFLMVYKQGIIMSIVWFILIIGGCYIISLLLSYLNKKLKRS